MSYYKQYSTYFIRVPGLKQWSIGDCISTILPQGCALLPNSNNATHPAAHNFNQGLSCQYDICIGLLSSMSACEVQSSWQLPVLVSCWNNRQSLCLCDPAERLVLWLLSQKHHLGSNHHLRREENITEIVSFVGIVLVLSCCCFPVLLCSFCFCKREAILRAF